MLWRTAAGAQSDAEMQERARPAGFRNVRHDDCQPNRPASPAVTNPILPVLAPPPKWAREMTAGGLTEWVDRSRAAAAGVRVSRSLPEYVHRFPAKT